MRSPRVRVAAIVDAQPSVVRDVVATLPDNVTVYVVETGAGVLVTLERRRGLRTRRRVIRSLQRDLAAVNAAMPAH